MTTLTTLTKTPRTVIAAATSNSAGGSTRGSVDLRTAQGGLLTIKITNGGTGPTVQAVANVLVAHSSSATTPTLAAAGTDWKTIYTVGNGTTAATVGEWNIDIPAGTMWLEVEVTGNTAQAVTCEAFLSEITNASTT